MRVARQRRWRATRIFRALKPSTLIISERPIWATPARNEGQQAGSQHVRLKPDVGFWIPQTDSCTLRTADRRRTAPLRRQGDQPT